jgi:hypothetical protein
VNRYRWDADETIGVLQGRVRVEFENGESPEFRVGDAASVTVGDRAVWHIPEPFCEFFVLALEIAEVCQFPPSQRCEAGAGTTPSDWSSPDT